MEFRPKTARNTGRPAVSQTFSRAEGRPSGLRTGRSRTSKNADDAKAPSMSSNISGQSDDKNTRGGVQSTGIVLAFIGDIAAGAAGVGAVAVFGDDEHAAAAAGVESVVEVRGIAVIRAAHASTKFVCRDRLVFLVTTWVTIRRRACRLRAQGEGN